MKKQLKQNNWLIIILLIGLALRLYKIQIPILDLKPHREIHTAEETRNLYYDKELFYPKTKLWADEPGYYLVEFPLYNAIIVSLYEISGSINETWGRVVSVVSSVGVVIFFYLFTKQQYGQYTALWTIAFFYILSPQEIVMSRSFQPDQFGLLLGVSSLYYLSQWLEKKKIISYIISFTSLLLMFLVKISFFPIIFPMFYLMFREWRKRTNLHLPILIFFLTVAPTILWFYHVRTVYLQYPQLHSKYLLSSESWIVLERFTNIHWYVNIFYDFIDQVMPLPIFLLSLLGLFMKMKKNLNLIFVWALGLLIYAVLFSHNLHFWYYLLPFLFPFSILAGLGVSSMSKMVTRSLRHPTIFVFTFITLMIFMSARYFVFRMYTIPYIHSAILETAFEVKRLTLPHSKIIASSYNHAALTYYALRPDLWGATFVIQDPTCINQCSIDRFEDLITWGATIYAISDKRELSNNPTFNSYLKMNFPILVEGQKYIIYNLKKSTY